MTNQHPAPKAHPQNAHLIAFIIIFNFVAIGGLILVITPTLFRFDNQAVIVALPTAILTPLSPTTPDLLSTPTPTLPPDAVTPVPTNNLRPQEAPAGDASNGQVLFNTFQPAASFSCATCHYVDREDPLIGPGLLNVSIRAESRVPGMRVYEYLHTAIVNPGAFVVPNFPDGLMPRNWAQIYSEQELNDIIAYLMTLQ